MTSQSIRITWTRINHRQANLSRVIDRREYNSIKNSRNLLRKNLPVTKIRERAKVTMLGDPENPITVIAVIASSRVLFI